MECQYFDYGVILSSNYMSKKDSPRFKLNVRDIKIKQVQKINYLDSIITDKRKVSYRNSKELSKSKRHLFTN